MKPVLVLAALPLMVVAHASLAADDDALQSFDPSASFIVHRDGKLHRYGFEQLRLRELYADYCAAQDLTLAQSDDIVRALAEERVLTTSWSTGKIRHVPNADDAAAAREIRAQVEHMLGRERYAALVAYEETLPERMQLRELSDWLRVLGQPLTIEQKEALVAVLVSERHRLDGSLLQSPAGSSERAAEVIALHDSFDRHVLALFEPILARAQREIADKQFADRSVRRHDALDRHARARAEGDERTFTYPD